jgi:CHASE3 domain sensor protein
MSQVDSRTIINVFFIIVTIIIGVYVIFLFSNIETEVNNTHVSQKECVIRK